MGCKQGTVEGVQVQAFKIGRKHGLELVAHGEHFSIALLAALGAIV